MTDIDGDGGEVDGDGSANGGDRRLVAGWHGRFYEDFTVGDVYKHPYGRTVTETDNVWFTNLTLNVDPMHFNEPYAAATEFGERLVDGTYVVALAVGMSVVDVSVNATQTSGTTTFATTRPSTTATPSSPRARSSTSARASRATTSASSPPNSGRTTRTTTSCCRWSERRWS